MKPENLKKKNKQINYSDKNGGRTKICEKCLTVQIMSSNVLILLYKMKCLHYNIHSKRSNMLGSMYKISFSEALLLSQGTYSKRANALALKNTEKF